jgi:hypothetical protein
LSSRESQLQIRGNPQHEFARKSAPQPQFPANPVAPIPAISIAGQTLQDISRTTKDRAKSEVFERPSSEPPPSLHKVTQMEL